MAAVAGRQLGHVASDAIAVRCGMRFLERSGVATEAAIAEIRRGLNRFLVRIVASAAP